MAAVEPLAYNDAPAETDDDAFLAALPRTEPLKRTAGALAALENARIAVREDPVREELESAAHLWDVRLHQAMLLSGGSLEVCEALLRGEKVPYSRLDREWARRLGVL